MLDACRERHVQRDDARAHLQARTQLVLIERLHQIIVRARLQPFDQAFLALGDGFGRHF